MAKFYEYPNPSTPIDGSEIIVIKKGNATNSVTLGEVVSEYLDTLYSGTGNPFDQNLNTTDSPEFAGIDFLSRSPSSPDSIMIHGGNATVTGERNITIGRVAGDAMVGAARNVVIGDGAGAFGEEYSDCVIIGASGANCEGDYNIFIGSGAGNNTGVGENNVYIGTSASERNIGNDNVTIGNSAGFGFSAGDYGYCVAIGSGAGYSLTTGDYNTFIGAATGDNVLTGSKNICIGYNAKPSSDAATNQCIIGGLTTNAVNVGINNNNPQYRLDVGGDVNVTGDIRKNGVAMTNLLMPVDLTGASVDYNLSVGQSAYITYSNATTVPLRVQTQDGVYSVRIVGDDNNNPTTNGTASILPNGTTYAGEVSCTGSYYSIGSSATYVAGPNDRLSLGWNKVYFAELVCHTSLAKKRMQVVSSCTGNNGSAGSTATHRFVVNAVNIWTDTDTPWTSLGTLDFVSHSQSGTVVVTRIS